MANKKVPSAGLVSLVSIILVLACTMFDTEARNRSGRENAALRQSPGAAAKCTAGKTPESIAGSTVNSVLPATIAPGVATTICFSVTHVSSDLEYLDRFDVDLPDGWTVNSVTNTPDSDGCGDGTTQGVSAGNVVYWQTVGTLPTGCGSWNGATVSFCVNVTVPDCTGAPWTLPWNLTGDGWGGTPHALAGSVALDCGAPTGEPVLVISPDSNVASLLTALSAYPDYYPVLWNNSGGNPTATDMAPYCVVVIGNDLTWESASLDKTAIGNSLADYLDGGGHVIESEYLQSYDNWGFGGRYMTDGYSPFTLSTLDSWNPSTMTITAPAHPVMAGVSSIGDNFGQQDTGLASGATLLATWSGTGYNAVAVKPNVVALNMLICQSADWTGDVPLLLHNALGWLCPLAGANVQPDGSDITAEDCSPANGLIDPGETVTVSLGLHNVGADPTASLVATLQASGGVTSPSGPQNYGVLVPGGATVAMPFTFTADPALVCGETLTVTLQLQDGATDLGTATYDYTLGAINTTVNPAVSNPAAITIPSSGAGTPYPSTVDVSGLTGTIYKVTATITDMNHTWPDDIDVLLVGPAGQKVSLMQNAGSSYDLVNVTLTFDDAASGALPDAAQITSGTYKPSQYGTVPTYPAPAPAGPYSTALSAFIGTDPNGTWSLYVIDDSGGDSGSIGGGWEITITTQLPECCVGCPTITLTPGTLPDGNIGAVYSQTLVPSGGTAPYTMLLTSGSLPFGLSFDTATGVISGTPTAAGLYIFDITATDSYGCSTAVTLTINVTYGFDWTYYDDLGRSQVCINSATGYYAWYVLTSPPVTGTYIGQATIMPTVWGYTVIEKEKPSGIRLYIYNTANRATGSFQKPPLKTASGLIDTDLTDDPACP